MTADYKIKQEYALNIFDYTAPIVDSFMAKRIYARRKQIGMTQTKLSDSLGCSQSALSKMENGKLSPIFTVQKLCKTLKVDPYEFFNRDEDSYFLGQFLEAEHQVLCAKAKLTGALGKKQEAARLGKHV